MSPRKPALIFIFITLFLDVLGVGLIIPVLPSLVKEIHPGGIGSAAPIYGWLAGLYSLMQFLFAPIIGSLSDQYGRRPVILLSLLGSGLDYFLLAWAPSLVWLFVGRIISGITGANFSAASAYIADVSTREKRSANFGIIGAAFGLGFVCGPALGGWIGGEFGLRAPFIAAGVITLLNWLYGLFILPESLKPENKRPFKWRRSNPGHSLIHLLKKNSVLMLASSFFISTLAHQVYPAIWVLYTAYRYEWGPRQTGLSLALVGLMAAIVQGGLARRIIPKLGEKTSAVVGFTVMAIALSGYAIASEGWMIYPIIVFGSFSGIAVPAIQGMISKSFGDDEQGRIQGSLTSLQSIAGFLGPIMATAVFGYFIGNSVPVQIPGAPFFLSSLLTLLAAGLAASSPRIISRSAE
ncbi:MAG: tetracycline resistance MFS efflux pump [Verrucomicrobiales bacterium]|nr:tetracycline resistance MFS efflux pump [Verrucomicrobiales bacterium]